MNKSNKKKEEIEINREGNFYSPKVMDHFMHPRNVGELKGANGVGEVGNPVCGDIMKMYLKIKDEKIVDAKFQTFGCGAAIATSSMATELIKGKTIKEALEITDKVVAENLEGLPSRKLHCSTLAEEAIKLAIKDYMAKSSKLSAYGRSRTAGQINSKQQI